MMTAEKIRVTLDNALAAENSGSAPQGTYVRALQTVIVDQAETIDKLIQTARVMHRKLEAVTGGKAPTAVAGASAPATAPPTPNGQRLGADGNPLTAEEAALEAQMDAAIAAQEAEKAAKAG